MWVKQFKVGRKEMTCNERSNHSAHPGVEEMRNGDT
jgi:hypothetical protein